MKKLILLLFYCIFFIWFVFPFMYLNNLYLWSSHDEKDISEIRKESLYIIVWNNDLAINFIKFKIKEPFFHYEMENEKNYDLFMTSNNFSLEEISFLIKNRPESYYYYLGRLLLNNDQAYFNQSDLSIINSLKVLLNKEEYRKEILNKYKFLIPTLIKRVNKIEEKVIIIKYINNI